jgi:imidazolonepropionase-like amidohydrolase
MVPSATLMIRSLCSLMACMAILATQSEAQTIVLRGGMIYTAPDVPPITAGTVVLRGGKIAAVGSARDIPIPSDAQVIDVTGKVVMAGFWNSHVHFPTGLYGGADTADAAVLAGELAAMLSRWGFTSVFDTGSPLANTLALRRRIDATEIPGPRILTTGDIIFPTGARNPKYGASTPAEAMSAACELLAGGVSAIKLYAQAWWDSSLTLSPEVIRAVVSLAREHGIPVFAHPSNRVGLHNAVENGVDVLVHTTPQIGPWSDALVADMKARDVALIPTLSLWRFELQRDSAPQSAVDAFVNRGVAQLRQYFEAGGPILFGTDVGYMTDYDTRLEFELMAQAGMGYRDILAALTTVPANRHGAGTYSGKIAEGFDADIVVLNADPAKDIAAFANVQYVFRTGRLIYWR